MSAETKGSILSDQPMTISDDDADADLKAAITLSKQEKQKENKLAGEY